MPLWLFRLLPYGAAALALGFAVWYLDHQGYARAQRNMKVQMAATYILLQDQARKQEQTMTGLVSMSDVHLSNALGKINITEKTIVQPTLTKEIHSDPRFTNPDLGITDGMLGAINTARQASARPCPPGSNAVSCSTLPSTEPTGGPSDRDSSSGGQ